MNNQYENNQPDAHPEDENNLQEYNPMQVLARLNARYPQENIIESLYRGANVIEGQRQWTTAPAFGSGGMVQTFATPQFPLPAPYWSYELGPPYSIQARVMNDLRRWILIPGLNDLLAFDYLNDPAFQEYFRLFMQYHTNLYQFIHAFYQNAHQVARYIRSRSRPDNCPYARPRPEDPRANRQA